LRFRWEHKREKIRAAIREALKEHKLSKNRCIAAVQEIEKMKYGRASSDKTIADELDKMAAKGDSIAKQYAGRRSEGAWYTTMYHEGLEVWQLLILELPIAGVKVELNELHHSSQNLSKGVLAKRVAVLLRSCEYLKLLAFRRPLLPCDRGGGYGDTMSKIETQIDKLRQDIDHFIYSDSIYNDKELMDAIEREYIKAEPDLALGDPKKTLELLAENRDKSLWWQLCKCSKGYEAAMLVFEAEQGKKSMKMQS
jgi:hypothetical protein